MNDKFIIIYDKNYINIKNLNNNIKDKVLFIDKFNDNKINNFI